MLASLNFKWQSCAFLFKIIAKVTSFLQLTQKHCSCTQPNTLATEEYLISFPGKLSDRLPSLLGTGCFRSARQVGGHADLWVCEVKYDFEIDTRCSNLSDHDDVRGQVFWKLCDNSHRCDLIWTPNECDNSRTRRCRIFKSIPQVQLLKFWSFPERTQTPTTGVSAKRLTSSSDGNKYV